MIDDSFAVEALRFVLFVIVSAALIGLPVIGIRILLKLNRKLDTVLEILKSKS